MCCSLPLLCISSAHLSDDANALRQKLLYPERGMQYYLVPGNANSRERSMLPSNDVLCSKMKTSSHDGRNLAKSNPRKTELLRRREAPLETRTDLTPEATKDISGAMNAMLADVFALYLKTKNFHWHMSGHHFRDYHLLLDEHAEQLFAMTDVIAERVRNACSIMMPNTSSHWTCSPSWRTTIKRSRPVCARRTTCATNIVTSRRPV
jgi:hypothetical protein